MKSTRCETVFGYIDTLRTFFIFTFCLINTGNTGKFVAKLADRSGQWHAEEENVAFRRVKAVMHPAFALLDSKAPPLVLRQQRGVRHDSGEV